MDQSTEGVQGPGVHVLYFPPSDGLLVGVGTFLCLNFFSRLFGLFPPPLGLQRCGGSRPCGKEGGERGGIFFGCPAFWDYFYPKYGSATGEVGEFKCEISKKRWLSLNTKLHTLTILLQKY